jgi:5'(3')-deoxyribonucleotidase
MFKLYVDLDGVLTDFDKQFFNFFHTHTSDLSNSEVWNKIDNTDESFWSSMDWLPNGKKLWDTIKKYNPIILTSPSNHPSSIKGKILWMEKNLPNTPYIIEPQKEKYAIENSILIDDKEKNIKKWIDNNGIGILYKNPKNTIEKLNNIIENLNKKEKIKESCYTLFNTSKKLISLNKIKEANLLQKIAETIEKSISKKPIKKFLWLSGDERLETVKEVLDNLIRKKTNVSLPENKISKLENILKKLKEMSVKEYSNQNEIIEDKKKVLYESFIIHPDIAELIGLLFKPIETNKEFNYITNLIKKKAQPFLSKKPKQTYEDDYYISPIFKEMLKKQATQIN